ncbi:MAG: hypothetical protein QXD77_00160 [Candidatus Aenigmatarchaeota archaeon]
MATGCLKGHDNVLDNFNSGAIYGYIVANPGVNYSRIREDLKLNNGSVIHHLDVLEKFGYIESYKDGYYRRYVPRGKPAVHVKTKREEKVEFIIGVLERSPGSTHKSVAESIGVSTRRLSYYLKTAVESGAVRAERRGKCVHYYPL